MGRIQILDENTINKIAAGEVIERPSSIVKELVENALDAGASSIQIEIAEGGKAYISVKDNGSGILKSDVEKVFERHGTSKIQKAEDLFHIKSMGFRGEAMASIAAVAEVELTTKAGEEEDGTLIDIRGGVLKRIEGAGHPVGTTVTVRNLFFNIPARKKFLKSDLSEQGSISDVVERQALAHPEVSIRFIMDGKTTLHTPGNGDLLAVIQCIYGKNIVKSLVPVDHPSEAMKITGYTSKTELSKGNSTYILCDINGRPVKSRTVIEAVRQSYRNLLMNHRYPFTILQIETDPERIDVNVHPQKHEIRVTDERALFNTVYVSIKSALNRSVMIMGASEDALAVVSEKVVEAKANLETGANLINRVKATSEAVITPNFLSNLEQRPLEQRYMELEPMEKRSMEPRDISYESRNTERISVKDTSKAFEESSPFQNSKEPQLFEKPAFEETAFEKKVFEKEVFETPISSDAKDRINTIGFTEIYEDSVGKEHAEANSHVNSVTVQNSIKNAPNYRVIGQHLNTYILIQAGEDLFLVDQHAAHERINYEYLRDSYFTQEVQIQELMMPVLQEVSMKEKSLYEQQRSEFVKFGIEMEWFGENTMAIRSVPVIMGEPLSGKVLGEILNEISSEKDPHERTEKILKSMACKGSVKAFDALSMEEMEGLMGRLFACKDPYNCPHGRPVIISFTKQDLEKRFKRIL